MLSLVCLRSADQRRNNSFTYSAFSSVKLQRCRYCSVLKKGALGCNVITLVWAVFFLSLCYLIQTGTIKKYNKCKYGKGWENLKVSVYKVISNESTSRYEKDIVIKGRISDSKNFNKNLFGYHVIICLQKVMDLFSNELGKS